MSSNGSEQSHSQGHVPLLSSQPLANSNPYGHPPPHPYYQQQQHQSYSPTSVASSRPPQHHGMAASMHSSAPAGPSQGAAGPSASALAGAAILAGQKSRSVMACVLCRKQKMKCEGPDKAPCKRCRTAGVECTFEAPPAAAPRARGGGASEAYVEARFSQVEDRIANLENAPPPQTVALSPAAPTSSALVARNGAIVTDHERRIAALEAQVYALHLSVANPPPPPAHLQAPPNPYFSSQPQYATKTFSHYSGHTATASPPLSKPQFDAASGPCLFANGDAFRQRYPPEGTPAAERQHRDYEHGDYEHRDKRHKAELPVTGELDFIERGVVTEAEASLCFESYFHTFPQPSGQPPSPLDPLPPSSSSTHSNHGPSSRLIRLPFAETRARSSLLLATIVSIGARSLSRFDTYQATLAEAIRLCHGTFLSEPGEEPTSLDLKGMMLLSLYNGMPDLMSHGITLTYRFGAPTALLEFERLSEEDKVGKKGRILVRRGRTFLVSFLWTSFYSYCRGLHGFYHVPSDVIRKQLDILESSKFTEPPSDRRIRVNVEECLILRDVFDKLGPGMRMDSPSYEELFEIVEAGSAQLAQWDKKWVDVMETVTQWGDSRELKTAVPLHHGRMCLLLYIFRDMVVDGRARTYPKMREFARMGAESALVILCWGVESRIWLPHSMVAQYLHHVNIPNAITLLYTVTRLFPSDACFPLIRRLLHRLLKQCDSCIAGNNGTKHEVARALETKRVVLEFDRYAFEEGGEDAPDGEVKEEGGLFGDEVTASLEGMRLEQALWGIVLVGALDD